MQAVASLYMASRMCRHGRSKAKERPGAPPPVGKSLQAKQNTDKLRSTQEVT